MEVVIIAKAKQGFIYRHMIERGLSGKELADKIGLSQQMLGKILNFQWFPSNNRRAGNTISKLENYFHVPIEYLFPPEITEEIAAKLGKKRVEFRDVDLIALDSVEQEYLTYDPQEGQEEERLAAALEQNISSFLRPREEKCIRLLFGIGTEKESVNGG